MRFDGKCVVILGGNAGIGLAAARLFRGEGAKLALTGRNAETLAAAAEECEALGIVSDIGDPAQSRAAMAEIAERLGGIDVLFVNAGIGGFAPVPEVSEEFWDGIHDVNLKGAFFAIQAALPLIRDGGAIVITGSVGSIAAVAGNVVYAAAKAGLRAMARILAKELLSRRIRVNVLSPGPTDTEIFKRGAPDEEVSAMRELFNSIVPIGRMGTPEEVAKAALFLASEEASFINGVDLYVDGGCVELGS
jgi:NAD(P)-dependent dehydrogenase (short-subunit alcohol dehydrogenase family)